MLVLVFRSKSRPPADQNGFTPVFRVSPSDDEAHYDMTVRDINEAFAALWPRRDDGLLIVLRQMMAFLQEKYHSRDFSDVLYAHAADEYPVRYEDLMRGLNESTLREIIRMDRDTVIECGGDFSGEDFVTRFKADQKAFAPKPQAAIMRESGQTGFRLSLVVSNG